MLDPRQPGEGFGGFQLTIMALSIVERERFYLVARVKELVE